ncbi:MAG: LamG domain-containing protein [Ornithinimicrobium sp.]
MSGDALVLDLPLDHIASGTTADASGHDNHGRVAGTPTVVADPYFGAAMAFVAGDVVVVADSEDLRTSGDQTIEAWVRPESLAAQQGLLQLETAREEAITIGPAGQLEYRYASVRSGEAVGEAASPAQEFQSERPLAAGEWAHLAVVRDLTRMTVSWFVDGEPAGTRAATPPEGPPGAASVRIGNDGAEGFEGRIAHVRVYGRALTKEEIQRDIHQDQTATAAFRMAHPLELCLLDKQERGVLYITDADVRQSYGVELLNTTQRTIRIEPPQDSSATLEVSFRRGVLTGTSLSRLATTTDGWQVVGTSTPEADVVRLVRTKTLVLPPGEPAVVGIDGLDVAPGGGTRGSRVQFTYSGVHLGGRKDPRTGTRVTHVSIVDDRGRSDLPLSLAVRGPDSVLNDGSTENIVRLELRNHLRPDPENPDASMLHFTAAHDDSEGSRLVVSFDTGTDLTSATDLTTIDLARQTVVEYPAATTGGSAPQFPHAGGDQALWVVPLGGASLPASQTLLLDLTGLVTGHEVGGSELRVRTVDITGYRDGLLTTRIRRGPVTVATGNRVGVGITTPKARLHLFDKDQDANGHHLVLGPTTASNLRLGHHKDYSWIQSHGSKPLALNPLGNQIGIGTGTPGARLHVLDKDQDANGHHLVLGPTAGSHLRLGHHQAYSWIQSGRDKPLALNPIGSKVGIGTTSPGARLQVLDKDQDANGHHLVLGLTTGSNLRLGHHKDYSWIQSHGGKPLALNPLGNKVGIGTTAPRGPLEVKDSNPQLLLTNPSDNTWALFVDGKDKLYFRYHTGGKLKRNGASLDQEGELSVDRLKIGGQVLDEKAIEVLAKLVNGTLEVELYNTKWGEYLYAAGFAPYDNDRRRVFTWRRRGRVNEGRFRLSHLS